MSDTRTTVQELMDRADAIVMAMQALPEENWDELEQVVQMHYADSVSKLEALGYVNRRLRSEVQLLDEEIRRLKKRRDHRAKALDRVRGLAQDLLTTHLELYPGPVRTDRFSISLIRAPKAKLTIESGAEVPEQFLVEQPPAIDKAAVRAHLESGNELAWASLVQSSYVRWS